MGIQASELAVRGNRLLRFYAVYSLAVSLIILSISTMDVYGQIIGSPQSGLRLYTTLGYVTCAAIFMGVSWLSPNVQHATAYFFIETALLSTLMVIAGGLASGFSSLILFSVVIANLLAPGMLGYGVAAWVTLAVMFTQHYLPDRYDANILFASGFYGGLCFLLAALTQALALRLNSALELASEQSLRIRRLQRFSWQALLDLPNGIIGCNRDMQVLFFNEKAQNWLDLGESRQLPQAVMDCLPHHQDEEACKMIWKGEQLLIRKVMLSDSEPGDFLLYIEDQSSITAAAQQLKLASLGRLTASIAHEIRNPLSALRQASQLLAETPYLESGEQYLTEVIEQHCMRINRTIEDILQLSRKRQPLQEGLRLDPWLQHFAQQFRSMHKDKPFALEIDCPADLMVTFDPDHLQQILHNICANGLRYALKQTSAKPALGLKAQISGTRVQLDIIDNGGGVTEEQARHLFEPFYTTEHNGTGLGLYLCRELCEANQTSIQYQPIPSGSCFRLMLRTDKHP
jgi:two-component system, NtrC family, sensor histidine kinase PilS